MTATFKFAMIQEINVYAISFLQKMAQFFLIRILYLKKSTSFEFNFKKFQRDDTLYSILFPVSRSTCFGRNPRP
jgi:hypothetical protein